MGDYAIRMQFDLDADGAVVRRAIETEEGIRAWWSSHSELGGEAPERKLRVSFPDQPQPFEFAVRPAGDGVDWVTGANPPWWAGTTVSLRVGPNPDPAATPPTRTRLQFAHGGYDPDNPVIPIVTPAWALILMRLKGYVETGEPQPFFDF
jgi:hypothetical protein